MSFSPTWNYEKIYWDKGITLIAGIDEVGMGALAGPVVAAAVIFKESTIIESLKDSKKLTPKIREEISIAIKQKALAWAVGQASVDEITKLNIRGAAHLAMRRAVDALNVKPDMLLIDGTKAQPHPHISAENLIKGDQKSCSIAAASVIAKVYRDNIMASLDIQFPTYQFASNKGYGTADHLLVLKQYGPSPHHRPTYGPVEAAKKSLSLASGHSSFLT